MATPDEPDLLRARAARYAAGQERCSSQVRRKLRDWGADADTAARIVEALTRERLIDDARFARVYAGSKRQKGWGALKVKAGLRQLGLADAVIALALSETADAALTEAKLDKALRQKAATLTKLPPRERAARLTRFALQRGFDGAQIRAGLQRLAEPAPEADSDSPYEP